MLLLSAHAGQAHVWPAPRCSRNRRGRPRSSNSSGVALWRYRLERWLANAREQLRVGLELSDLSVERLDFALLGDEFAVDDAGPDGADVNGGADLAHAHEAKHRVEGGNAASACSGCTVADESNRLVLPLLLEKVHRVLQRGRE